MLYMLAAQLNYFMVRFLKLVNFIYFYGCLTESLLLHMVLFQYGRGHGLTFCFLVTEREEINFFFYQMIYTFYKQQLYLITNKSITKSAIWKTKQSKHQTLCYQKSNKVKLASYILKWKKF